MCSESGRILSSRRPALLGIVVIALVVGGFASPAYAQLGARLIISEFQLRGLNSTDEFVEIYNPNDAPVTVTSVTGAGYALVASDGVARFIIPNGTVIPARGHYLGVNSLGYSLASYPAGSGQTAVGNATYTTDIPDNAGIALFWTSLPADFTPANRIDAVGSTSEANVLYREGTGYPAVTPFVGHYSFYRASVTGFPQDTNDNAADFVFVDTNGTAREAGQRLGTPGPENLAGPNQTGTGIFVTPLDPAVGFGRPANFELDFTSDPANNSTFGTIALRRRIWNSTGVNITRLRIRISFINTFPSPSGVADLRPRTSGDIAVGTSVGVVTVRGTTLEQPPSQPNGGGFNSSMGVGFVTLAAPLPAGGSVPVNLLFGVQQTGTFRISMNVEALPSGGASSVHVWEGRTVSDFGNDGRADLAVFRAPAGQWWITQSSTSYTDALMVPWGLSTDLPALSDYDGDRTVDPAIFRPGPGGSSFWFIKNSSANYTTFFSVNWGTSGDVPVPGNYDTDRKADPAVYRPSTGQWLIAKSTGSYTSSLIVPWGIAGDVPVPADYDGDGRTDIAIYRPSTGQWFIKRSDSEYASFFVLQWGVQAQGDIPVPADFDGDGKVDPAVYRPGVGTWFVRTSNTGYIGSFSVQWGVQAQNDQPMPADFDGDGRTDPAIYRPGTGLWYVLRSSSNYTTIYTVQWGNQGLGDIPVRER